MAYLVCDTETTGLMNFKLPADDPSQPRIASLAMIFVDDDLNVEAEHACFIRPDGWELSEEIKKLTGLTMEKLETEGIPIVEALAIYTKGIEEKRISVAHNHAFDGKMIRGEYRRAGLPDLFEQTPNLCTMRTLTDVCKIPPNGNRGGYKFPKLSEACVFFGMEEYGDHSSLNDARAVLGLMREMRKRSIPFPEARVHYARPDHPALPTNRPPAGTLTDET